MKETAAETPGPITFLGWGRTSRRITTYSTGLKLGSPQATKTRICSEGKPDVLMSSKKIDSQQVFSQPRNPKETKKIRKGYCNPSQLVVKTFVKSRFDVFNICSHLSSCKRCFISPILVEFSWLVHPRMGDLSGGHQFESSPLEICVPE
jgi:hypothetical protein